ncbi:hypothetical protein AOLI_G00219750 [Acnodon oligacanthus]
MKCDEMAEEHEAAYDCTGWLRFFLFCVWLLDIGLIFTVTHLEIDLTRRVKKLKNKMSQITHDSSENTE